MKHSTTLKYCLNYQLKTNLIYSSTNTKFSHHFVEPGIFLDYFYDIKYYAND